MCEDTASYQAELYLTTAMYKTREHLEFNSRFIILNVTIRFHFGYHVTYVLFFHSVAITFQVVMFILSYVRLEGSCD